MRAFASTLWQSLPAQPALHSAVSETPHVREGRISDGLRHERPIIPAPRLANLSAEHSGVPAARCASLSQSHSRKAAEWHQLPPSKSLPRTCKRETSLPWPSLQPMACDGRAAEIAEQGARGFLAVADGLLVTKNSWRTSAKQLALHTNASLPLRRQSQVHAYQWWLPQQSMWCF